MKTSLFFIFAKLNERNNLIGWYCFDLGNLNKIAILTHFDKTEICFEIPFEMVTSTLYNI